MGMTFLELGLDQSSANVGNGEEESVEVIVHPLRDTHEETIEQGRTRLSEVMMSFIS